MFSHLSSRKVQKLEGETPTSRKVQKLEGEAPTSRKVQKLEGEAPTSRKVQKLEGEAPSSRKVQKLEGEAPTSRRRACPTEDLQSRASVGRPGSSEPRPPKYPMRNWGKPWRKFFLKNHGHPPAACGKIRGALGNLCPSFIHPIARSKP